MDDVILMAESEEELNSLLMRVKEKSKRDGLRLNIKKTKIIASSPIIHDEQMGKQWQTLFSWAPKSLQIAPLKLKDACSWDEEF